MFSLTLLSHSALVRSPKYPERRLPPGEVSGAAGFRGRSGARLASVGNRVPAGIVHAASCRCGLLIVHPLYRGANKQTMRLHLKKKTFSPNIRPNILVEIYGKI